MNQAGALIPILVEKKIKDNVEMIQTSIDHMKSVMPSSSVFETFLGDLKEKFALQDQQLTKVQRDIDTTSINTYQADSEIY